MRALGKAKLVIGNIVFLLEQFDPSKFDEGIDLVPAWIQVLGLPCHLW
jgi:hypothetical protein